MNIVKHINEDNVIKLLVNSLKDKAEIDELLAELQEPNKYEVTLLNIKVLPLSVIIRFEKLKNNLTIVVNEAKLKYYLRDLGFYIKYKEHYKISKANKISKVQYVALGGSAGSLEKFIEIIKALPASDLTIFIVMHQRADMKSSLAEILQRHTKFYTVLEASTDTIVMPSTIYVAPPNQHMLVAGGFIFLTDDEPKNFSKPSISTTFESLSHEYREALLTILVCGYGSDGSDSLHSIRKNGGAVIIEQLYECKATIMLENAIYSKEYDYILSINDISRLLYEKLTKDYEIESYLDEFLDDIYEVYGYDYRNYHRPHIIRRIEHFYNILMLDSFVDFRHKVLNDIDIFKDMFLNISVNVTTFFRNPLTYKKIKDDILHNLKDKNSIKIWCAGSSSGEEPYSIAIILKELGLLDKSLIYATDINDIILQHAKNGIYSNENYKLFYKHYLESGGDNDFDEYFQKYDNFVVVNEEIKEKILYFRHNLVTDGVINEFQLIFCRNVLIYFDNTLKKRVFNLFDDSLEDFGFLLLGESENFDNRDSFIEYDRSDKIYMKKNHSE